MARRHLHEVPRLGSAKARALCRWDDQGWYCQQCPELHELGCQQGSFHMCMHSRSWRQFHSRCAKQISRIYIQACRWETSWSKELTFELLWTKDWSLDAICTRICRWDKTRWLKESRSSSYCQDHWNPKRYCNDQALVGKWRLVHCGWARGLWKEPDDQKLDQANEIHADCNYSQQCPDLSLPCDSKAQSNVLPINWLLRQGIQTKRMLKVDHLSQRYQLTKAW